MPQFGGVLTEERYEVWPPNMGFLPPRLCRAAGDDQPSVQPLILTGFLDGVSGSAIRAASQCTTIARGSISGYA